MAVIPRSDPPSRSHPEPQTLKLDRLPDDILLLVLGKIGDVKTLGRCCIVSRRFHSLVPQVANVVVHVDSVNSDAESSSLSSIKTHSAASISARSVSAKFRCVICRIAKPLQVLRQFLGTKKSHCTGSSSSSSSLTKEKIVQSGVKHHSLTQVLKKFKEIRYLHIKLPGDELDNGVLLKWRAEFGYHLDNLVIFRAKSVIQPNQTLISQAIDTTIITNDIPESFHINESLNLAADWTINTLITASERHDLILPILSNHKRLQSYVLTDGQQGVLCMNKDQLEELRKKLLSRSLASERTRPILKFRLVYAPTLELPDGTVFKGGILAVIRSSESKKELSDISWVTSAFEEPYKTAAEMMFMRKICTVEMNSF